MTLSLLGDHDLIQNKENPPICEVGLGTNTKEVNRQKSRDAVMKYNCISALLLFYYILFERQQ